MRRTFLLILLLILSIPLFSQNADLRGLKTVVGQLEGGTAVVGKQYAVLIAIDKYKNWMALRNPVKDAREIKDILSRRYYISDFIELYDQDATKAAIVKLFNKLITVARPEDSILIFYAGHGYLDKTSNTGFWIPVDGGMDLDEQANWLPNSQIRGFVSNMKARHIALLADSCFSGDILNPTRGVAPTITDEYFKNAYARISRQVLTSGASESVPDESQFTRQLKLALEGNTSPYLDPLMLYSQIRLGVKDTTPLFGDLKDSGHQEGASFLLFLRDQSSQGLAEQNASSTQQPVTRLKVEKTYGTVTIVTAMSGNLFLDGLSQGKVPAGNNATLENVETGPHTLVMQYEDGDEERESIVVNEGEATAVSFSHAIAALPVASIKIDGKFDDWKDIQPALFGRSTEKGNLVIDKVYLAVDSENLYMKFDINDDTPSSFLHSNNFNTGHERVAYGLTIQYGMLHIGLELLHTQNRWKVNVYRKPSPDKMGVIIDQSENYAMKGSSVEAAFPLKSIRDYFGPLKPGAYYMITAYAGYADGNTGVGGTTAPRSFTF